MSCYVGRQARNYDLCTVTWLCTRGGGRKENPLHWDLGPRSCKDERDPSITQACASQFNKACMVVGVPSTDTLLSWEIMIVTIKGIHRFHTGMARLTPAGKTRHTGIHTDSRPRPSQERH
jgi:hypothetical protein